MSDFHTMNSFLRGQDSPQPPSNAWGFGDPHAANNDLYTYHPQWQDPLEGQDTLAGLGTSGQYGAVPLERPLNGGTVDSYSGSDTDYSRQNTVFSGNFNSRFTQNDSQFQTYQPQTCLPDMLGVVSPDQLTTAASSPDFLNCGSDLLAAGDTVDRGGGYFVHEPGYSVGPVQHQPASSPLVPSPLSPSQPAATRHEGKQRTVVAHNYPGLDPQGCKTCREGCARPTDLERHLRTSTYHSPPSGPACPETGCKFHRKFTRADNFKNHYKKQHGKSDEEADKIIAEWWAGQSIRS